ncbi:hypothetical protein [Edwardsiella phage PEi26]|uniref:T4 y05I-like putative transcription factor C-terminal domain-containing protein n=1 Tax=Edwardsiella phage PEi26 TaxID=1608311 RepID=A0A0B6VTU6_9CAUD|nr:hypothetical protein [Edwardsiella phage PEi26]
MKVGLNYEGYGYGATIYNDDGDDDIRLNIKKTYDTSRNAIMTIKQGTDIIALDKRDIIALRDYLVQVTSTL